MKQQKLFAECTEKYHFTGYANTVEEFSFFKIYFYFLKIINDG